MTSRQLRIPNVQCFTNRRLSKSPLISIFTVSNFILAIKNDKNVSQSVTNILFFLSNFFHPSDLSNSTFHYYNIRLFYIHRAIFSRNVLSCIRKFSWLISGQIHVLYSSSIFSLYQSSYLGPVWPFTEPEYTFKSYT